MGTPANESDFIELLAGTPANESEFIELLTGAPANESDFIELLAGTPASLAVHESEPLGKKCADRMLAGSDCYV